MTRVTRPTFKTSTTTLYPSSGAGAISAADLRAQTDNIADSVGFVYVNTTNPAASDDIGDGYVPGDIWVNTTSDTDYICVDNAAGAAIWQAKQPLDAVLTNTTASFTTAQETKLGGVEALADVTDAANVTAAGAVMDSEVTNLADVKSFDPADYATTVQGVKADQAVWTYATAVVTTSGTAFDFDSIPSYANEVQLILSEVSLSGTDSLFIQIGDAGGLETSGYTGGHGGFVTAGNNVVAASASGFTLLVSLAARLISGVVTLSRLDGNTWVLVYLGGSGDAVVYMTGGSKTLSATLDRVRFTRTGTNTFDAGSLVARWRA